MNRNDKIQLEQLNQLDEAFREMLIPCLEECAQGRWGLFGGNDPIPEASRYLAWPEAEKVRELALHVQAILAQSGEQNPLCDEFLDLCTMHGESHPGEPRLARAFLQRIERGEVGRQAEGERRPW
jgi:hypothetical protein